MKVTLTTTGTDRHAVISEGVRELSVLLTPGRAVHESLRESAQEMREKAARLTASAALIERAADHETPEGQPLTPKRYPAAVFTPDNNSYYVYLNVTEAEAIEKFKANEDWLNLYQPAGYEPKPQLCEYNSFMLWHNKGADFAKAAEAWGLPPELFGQPPKSGS